MIECVAGEGIDLEDTHSHQFQSWNPAATVRSHQKSGGNLSTNLSSGLLMINHSGGNASIFVDKESKNFE